MPTANLLDEDEFTAVPVGPGFNDAINSDTWRGYWDGVNNRVRWLFNRLVPSLLGPVITFDASAIDSTSDAVHIPAHGITTNAPVRIGIKSGATIFSIVGSPLPTVAGGLLSSLLFYAIAVDADHLSFALTSGGAAVDISAIGSGTHYLFQVSQPLHALMHQSFTMLNGATIPAGTLVATLAGYFISTLGGALSGEIVLNGAAGRIVNRTTGSPANLPTVGNADATVDLSAYPAWRCPNQGGNHVLTVTEPTKAGLCTEIHRVEYSGGFAMVLKRAQDASTIGRLNEIGGLRLWSYDSGDGKGVTWHAAGMGGADQVS